MRDLSKVDWRKWPPWRKYERSGRIIEIVLLVIVMGIILIGSIAIDIAILF